MSPSAHRCQDFQGKGAQVGSPEASGRRRKGDRQVPEAVRGASQPRQRLRRVRDALPEPLGPRVHAFVLGLHVAALDVVADRKPEHRFSDLVRA